MSDLNLAVKYSYPAVTFAEQIPEMHEALIAVRTLFPDEVRPLGELGVSSQDQTAAKNLRKTLENAFKFGTEEEAKKAETVSRSLGGLVASHIGGIINDHPTFNFVGTTLGFNDAVIAIDEPKLILDHGVGINGLLSHRSHIKQPDHKIVISSIDEIQAYGLEGVARRLNFPEGSVDSIAGASDASEIALGEHGENTFDLILMSRIHGMEKKSMKTVTAISPLLLKPGGKIVVRSPQNFSRGHNAQSQAAALLENTDLKLVRTFTFPNEGTPNGDPYPQQAFVLVKQL